MGNKKVFLAVEERRWCSKKSFSCKVYMEFASASCIVFPLKSSGKLKTLY